MDLLLELVQQDYTKFIEVTDKTGHVNHALKRLVDAEVIETTKDKSPAAKNSKGNVLEYRFTLNSVIIIKDFLTNDKIVNQNFSYSTIYKVQKRNFETIKLENKIVEDLINRIYQNLLIKMSENILTK